MDNVRTIRSLEPSATRNGVKDCTSQSQVLQHRIEQATTVIVANDRYTTIYTLEIRPTKDATATETHTIHRCIFDAIKAIDDSTVIISLDQQRINHGKDMLKGDEYKKVFKDWRM